MRCRGFEHSAGRTRPDRIAGRRGTHAAAAGLPVRSRPLVNPLKVKRFHDAEARVIGHLPGAGRHKGRLGALAVVLPDGTEFAVGTGFTDAQREQPPAVGSIDYVPLSGTDRSGRAPVPVVRSRAA